MPGPFRLLIAFVDDGGSITLMNLGFNLSGGSTEIGITGAPRMIVIGSGEVVALELYEKALAWARTEEGGLEAVERGIPASKQPS